MDEFVRQSISIVEMRKKGTVPWQVDEPFDQPYHRWIDGGWHAIKAGTDDTAGKKGICSKLALYSWNIDFMTPYSDSRMRTAVRHLEKLCSEQPEDTSTVIHLNECLESDIALIKSDPWVQSTFKITDVDQEYWQSGYYGTTTLIDRRLNIRRCFRVHYSKTRMERDGLFVDIDMGAQKLIRLCNTHLESLANMPPFRPPQVELCAHYMHKGDVHGAILAGDLNAVQDFDKHLHTDNNLKDAYLELGGDEEDAEGHTWGQQAATAQRQRFGTTRMDKVLFCGKIICQSFERFGMDVEVEDEQEREDLVKLGFDKPWITDHLGVKAVFEVKDERAE